MGQEFYGRMQEVGGRMLLSSIVAEGNEGVSRRFAETVCAGNAVNQLHIRADGSIRASEYTEISNGAEEKFFIGIVVG